MDLKKIEEIVKDPKGGVIEKKETLISTLNQEDQQQQEDSSKPPSPPIDPATALQLFLDHIPITSIPAVKTSSSILEVKNQDCLKDSMRLLYENNVDGAPVVDDTDPGLTVKFSERYIGFISFASMVQWSIEVGALAKSFLWDPFFPVRLDDTLYRVLLLLSKHRLHVVPVTEGPNSKLVGFITQNAVIHLLLQSSGLEWFDNIADRALSEIRFANEERVVSVYGDETISDVVHILWEKRIGAVAVVERETQRLIGCVSDRDVYLLLENDDLFVNRKSMTVEQFIWLGSSTVEADPDIDRDLGALLSAGGLTLRNKFRPRMEAPVTSMKTDTLKQAMEKLNHRKSNFSFLVDESQRVRGLLTLRDVIIQFAPPCMDSTFEGGGFFESALEQSGCHVRNGTIICDH